VAVPVAAQGAAGSSSVQLGLLVAGACLSVGGVLVLVAVARAARGRAPALYPGDPGFDEAAGAAARAAGGVVSECEGVYWLTVPGRDPVRVRRLLEDRGQ